MKSLPIQQHQKVTEKLKIPWPTYEAILNGSISSGGPVFDMDPSGCCQMCINCWWVANLDAPHTGE